MTKSKGIGKGNHTNHKKKYVLGPMPVEPEFENSYPSRLIELMEQGQLNCQIQKAFNISASTFDKWRKQEAEFAKAYEIGRPRRFAEWLQKGIRAIEEKNDRGVKYWTVIMNNCFQEEGWVSEYSKGTTVNISNTLNNNTLQLSPQELLSNIKQSFNKLYEHEKDLILDIKPELVEYLEDGQSTKTKT